MEKVRRKERLIDHQFSMAGYAGASNNGKYEWKIQWKTKNLGTDRINVRIVRNHLQALEKNDHLIDLLMRQRFIVGWHIKCIKNQAY